MYLVICRGVLYLEKNFFLVANSLIFRDGVSMKLSQTNIYHFILPPHIHSSFDLKHNQ